jgi:hypothetical protein
MFFCIFSFVSFFPQLWKSFTTVVVNVFHSCQKHFPQLWKERNKGKFSEKDYNVLKNSPWLLDLFSAIFVSY